MENIWSYQKVYHDNTDVYYLSKANFHWIASSFCLLSDLRHSQIQISRKKQGKPIEAQKNQSILKNGFKIP